MNPQQAERLLDYLKSTSLLDGYSYAIYNYAGKEIVADKNVRCLCGAFGIPHLCNEICEPSLNVPIEDSLASKKSQFFRCPLGLFSFAIPVSSDSCLVCGGVRENLFDLYFCESEQFEFMKGKQKVHPYEILEQLEKLPVTTEKKVRETMLKAERLITLFMSGEKIQSTDPDSELQGTIRSVATAIGKAMGLNKAIAIFSETLGILFDIPLIALVLRDADGNGYHIETCWGTFAGPSHPAIKALPFNDAKYLTTILKGDEVTALFPGRNMNSAICLPLSDNNYLFGMAVLFDVSLTKNEISLAESLSAALIVKLKESIVNRETRHKRRDIRLLEMIRTLALTENQDDLLRLIMEMSAELVDAASGSLMLIDKSGKMLRVASALGINPVLAQSLRARIDEGIAGRVAASGVPLLIKDVEQEMNLGRQNRIRFATKSCISLPLRFKGKTIGVLNLADKKSNAPFTSDDQDILANFIDQAAVILVRSTTLRNARQNTVTDPLTGLYNPSFVKKRLNEELSRSIRYNLPLTLLIASLDNPATCHAGGDDRANTDRLVKEMARILNTSLRDIDLVGRFGEREFCVILPSTPLKESVFVAERIKRTIKSELSTGGQTPDREYLTTSVGIASFPENGASSKDMINAARAALSRAESEGGNKICCSAS
jgi:diguanylate cyclase (GGDEF)-like protein